MLAAFDGTCAECGGRFPAGTQIEPALAGGWQHAACPDTPDERADAQAKAAGPCARCGLLHPGEC